MLLRPNKYSNDENKSDSATLVINMFNDRWLVARECCIYKHTRSIIKY